MILEVKFCKNTCARGLFHSSGRLLSAIYVIPVIRFMSWVLMLNLCCTYKQHGKNWEIHQAKSLLQQKTRHIIYESEFQKICS